MPRRGLLIVAVAVLAVSFVGAAVQAPVSGSPGVRLGHMFDGGHMSRWVDDQEVADPADPIDGARELVVTASDYTFAPAEIMVTAAEPVNLTLDNQGRVPHDLVIAELGVRLTANPGRQASTGIVIDQTGTFEIVCTFPGHAAAGMTGEFEVLSD